jgi:hypothetical protein
MKKKHFHEKKHDFPMKRQFPYEKTQFSNEKPRKNTIFI